ncbi:MAG: STAS domain-containing protein [Gammaproteobacteria bacterium]
MNVTVTPLAGGFALAGELTIYTADPLRDALLSRVVPTQPLTLDLAAVSELDTAGVQVLLVARRLAGTLAINAAAPPVATVLERLGLAALLANAPEEHA